MAHQVSRLLVHRCDHQQQRFIRHFRGVPEDLERQRPRLPEPDARFDGTPRAARPVAVVVRGGSRNLQDPVAHLTVEGAGAGFVLLPVIVRRHVVPEPHPVELPEPFVVLRRTGRRRIEPEVDPAIRESIRNVDHRDFAADRPPGPFRVISFLRQPGQIGILRLPAVIAGNQPERLRPVSALQRGGIFRPERLRIQPVRQVVEKLIAALLRGVRSRPGNGKQRGGCQHQGKKASFHCSSPAVKIQSVLPTPSALIVYVIGAGRAFSSPRFIDCTWKS